MGKAKCLIVGRECPERASSASGPFCPAWVEGVVEVEAGSESKRAVSGCLLHLLPRWVTQGVHANAVNAAELSALRGGVVNGVVDLLFQRLGGKEVPEPDQLSDGDHNDLRG